MYKKNIGMSVFLKKVHLLNQSLYLNNFNFPASDEPSSLRNYYFSHLFQMKVFIFLNEEEKIIFNQTNWSLLQSRFARSAW